MKHLDDWCERLFGLPWYGIVALAIGFVVFLLFGRL